MFETRSRREEVLSGAMAFERVFDGRVWFSFGNRDVWRFYRFVLAFARAGNSVALEWSPLDDGSETAAMEAFLGLPDADARGRFLHAMLGEIHIEGASASDPNTITRSCAAAGVQPPTPSDETAALLAGLADEATSLGVTRTPTLYRHGPLLHVVVNAAAETGDLVATARSILDVADNDGIWQLSKP